MGRAERSVLTIGLVVLALVVAAIVTVVAIGSPAPAQFSDDSPEQALQDYFQAVAEGRNDDAYAMLSRRVQRETGLSAFSRDLAYSSLGPARSADVRVRIAEVTVTGERATLVLAVEHFSRSGIGFVRSSYERGVTMVREDGAWKLDEALIWL